MQELSPKLKELKEKHKGDKEKEAVETLELYKTAKVNPFSSLLVAFIQIPVLLALYWVFFHESFTVVNAARIYGFTPIPGAVSLHFLGLVLITGKSVLLAVVAGLTQYIQARAALSGTMKPAVNSGGGMSADFQKIMGAQLKYVFPFLIALISYSTSSAIALYFITTNIAGIAQEFYVRKKLESALATLS
jgi:YidC/Oxa1 family membrane protein insertase